jgi:HD-like signal output (HDOD) protein
MPSTQPACDDPMPADDGMDGVEVALCTATEWARVLQTPEIPVLASTASAIEDYRRDEDSVDAHRLGELIGQDPLMTLKVMAHAAAHRPPRLLTQPESVTTTLVMMGIGPFFRNFGRQPTIDVHLSQHPEAWQGLNEVLDRSRMAARIALGLAVHRLDPDAGLIHQAALLHDVAEMLLWCHAPAHALAVRRAVRAVPTRRTAEAERELLGVELVEVQHALLEAWQLPDLLMRVLDDRHADLASVRNVVLAVRLARHLCSPAAWRHGALSDDVADIAALVNLSPGSTLRLLRALDA